MANEFVARNGIIAKANSSITGTLDVSGNITMGTALVATRSWVTSTALTGYATENYVTTAINNLIDAAPGTLNTLNELAAALGDDPNFATTISNTIATKLPLAGGNMTGNINWTSTDKGLVWAMNSDGASIKFYNTADGDTNSRLEFNTLDNNNEYFRWTHSPSGGTLYESMKLVPNSSGNSVLTVQGSIYAGANKVATESWVTSQNYLTSYTNTYVTGAAFNTSTGVLTLTRNDAGTVTVDLDGKYAEAAHTHSAADITSGTLASARLSGTYAISITGNAATATSASSAGTASTVNGSSGQLLRHDNRTIAPNEISSGYLQFGFTSFNNNNTSPWADYLHLRSYTDASGGNDNLLVISKSTKSMRLYQQSWNSGTAYSSYVDFWTTGDFTGTDVTNWNTAYSWGNHASAGYLTSYTETDPIYTASSWYTTTNNSSNWNTAYSWGNHAGLYDNYGSWNLKTNGVQRTTVQSGGTLDIVAGTNVSVSYGAGGVVTINSTDTNTNNYLTGLSFATGTGVLTATRQGLGDLTVDLDGRYLELSGGTLYKSTASAGTTGTTFLEIHNYVGGDLSQQQSFIDFKFTDTNANWTPQVRIGAQVGRDADADAISKEGAGAFVVYTGNGTDETGGGILTEAMRVSYNGSMTVQNTITATGGNSTQWNSAYGWGDHSVQGYLTSYTETDTLATVTTRGNVTTNSITTSTHNIYANTNATFYNSGGNATFHQFESYWNTSSAGSIATLRFDVGTWRLWSAGIGDSVVTVKSNGYVNIGANTPLAKLSVGAGTTNTGSDIVMFSSNSTGLANVLSLVNETGGSNGRGVRLSFHNQNNWSATGAIDTIQTNGTESALVFSTYNSGLSEKMRITHDGNVAINSTTTSGYKLYVNGSTWINGGTNFQDGVSIFRTQSGAAEVMRIASNGNVGIGTTSPTNTLQVQPSLTSFDLNGLSNGAIALTNNSNGSIAPTIGGKSTTTGQPGLQIIAGTNDTNTNADMSFGVRESDNTDFATTSSAAFAFNRYITNLLTILRNGNVGIGTTSPGSKLDVVGQVSIDSDLFVGADGGANYTASRIRLYSHNNYRGAGVHMTGVDSNWFIGTPYTDFSGTFIIARKGVATSEEDTAQASNALFTVKSTGNVGIGTSSPGYKLDVSGDINASGEVRAGQGKFDEIKNRLTGNTIIDFDASNNVGIATTSSFGRLQIAGASTTPDLSTVTAANVSLVVSNSDIGYGTMFATYGSGVGALQQRRTNTNTYYDFALQPHGGRIGIGTLSPSYTLDVNGNARFSSTVTSTGFVGSLSGNATTASALATARTITLSGAVTGSASFDGSANITISTTATPDPTLTINGDASGSATFTNLGNATLTLTIADDSHNHVISNVDGLQTALNGKAGVSGTSNPQELAFFNSQTDITSQPELMWTGTDLMIIGGLQATTKSFNIEHPTKPGKRLVYGVLEGPEHGVYTRGRTTERTIMLPEEWTGLVDQDSITVQLTAVGKPTMIYVVDIKDNKVFVDADAENIEYFYYVQGTRKDIEKLEIEQ